MNKLMNVSKKTLNKRSNETICEYVIRLFKEYDVIKPKLNLLEREYVESVNLFFYDKKYTMDYLVRLRNNVINDMLNIYKLRNKIVHDAFISDDLINHYCIQCIKYTKIVLDKITKTYIANKDYTLIKDIIINLDNEYNILCEKIKKDSLNNALKEEYF